MLVSVGRAPLVEGLGLEAIGVAVRPAHGHRHRRAPAHDRAAHLRGRRLRRLLAARAHRVPRGRGRGRERDGPRRGRRQPRACRGRSTPIRRSPASASPRRRRASSTATTSRSASFPWVANARAVMQNETVGWVKSIHETRYGELLGLVMVGPHVTDLIEAGVVAIDAEATVETVADGMAAASDALGGDQGGRPRRARAGRSTSRSASAKSRRDRRSRKIRRASFFRAAASFTTGRALVPIPRGHAARRPRRSFSSSRRRAAARRAASSAVPGSRRGPRRREGVAWASSTGGTQWSAGPCSRAASYAIEAARRSRAEAKKPRRARGAARRRSPPSARVACESRRSAAAAAARAGRVSPAFSFRACDRRPRPVRAGQAGRGGAARARARARRQARVERGPVPAVPGGARGDRARRARAQPLPGRRRLRAPRRARRAARRPLRGGRRRRRRRRGDRPALAGGARPGRRDRLRLAVVPELRARRARSSAPTPVRVPLARPHATTSTALLAAIGAAHEARLRLPPEQPDRDGERPRRARRVLRRACPSTCSPSSTRRTSSTSTTPTTPTGSRSTSRPAAASLVLRTFSKIYGLAGPAGRLRRRARRRRHRRRARCGARSTSRRPRRRPRSRASATTAEIARRRARERGGPRRARARSSRGHGLEPVGPAVAELPLRRGRRTAARSSSSCCGRA